MIGEPGVGKTAVAEGLAEVVYDSCGRTFYNRGALVVRPFSVVHPTFVLRQSSFGDSVYSKICDMSLRESKPGFGLLHLTSSQFERIRRINYYSMYRTTPPLIFLMSNPFNYLLINESQERHIEGNRRPFDLDLQLRDDNMGRIDRINPLISLGNALDDPNNLRNALEIDPRQFRDSELRSSIGRQINAQVHGNPDNFRRIYELLPLEYRMANSAYEFAHYAGVTTVSSRFSPEYTARLLDYVTHQYRFSESIFVNIEALGFYQGFMRSIKAIQDFLLTRNPLAVGMGFPGINGNNLPTGNFSFRTITTGDVREMLKNIRQKEASLLRQFANDNPLNLREHSRAYYLKEYFEEPDKYKTYHRRQIYGYVEDLRTLPRNSLNLLGIENICKANECLAILEIDSLSNAQIGELKSLLKFALGTGESSHNIGHVISASIQKYTYNRYGWFPSEVQPLTGNNKVRPLLGISTDRLKLEIVGLLGAVGFEAIFDFGFALSIHYYPQFYQRHLNFTPLNYIGRFGFQTCAGDAFKRFFKSFPGVRWVTFKLGLIDNPIHLRRYRELMATYEELNLLTAANFASKNKYRL